MHCLTYVAVRGSLWLIPAVQLYHMFVYSKSTDTAVEGTT